jgi:ABC-type glycerol-3-phosphate transport system permease component
MENTTIQQNTSAQSGKKYSIRMPHEKPFAQAIIISVVVFCTAFSFIPLFLTVINAFKTTEQVATNAFGLPMFNTMFGGGCRYSCGEDTLFLRECLRKGLKIVAVPAALASIQDGDSTWFDGYTDKYFFDKGVLYYALDKRFCKLHALIHGFRYRKKYAAYGWKQAVVQMWKGASSLR